MFKPTYLYIKTHNKTGLKYFGKTTAKDPYKYKGSGVYWVRHINKHGYDVTTEIIGYYTDNDDCRNIALQFSIDNDIVRSKIWANLKEESLDGGWEYINANGLNLFENYSEDAKIRHINGSRKGGIISGMLAKKNGIGIFGLTIEQRKENSKKGRDVIKEKYSVESIFSILNKDPILNAKKKEIFKEIGHQQGEKNSQYGKMWITNEIDNKKIYKECPIPEGWRKGRIIK